MLTLTFLGVGSAFAKRNMHSNALVEAWSQGPEHQEVPDDNLLIDLGGLGPLALFHLKDKAGFTYLRHGQVVNYPAIRRIFVTHQHADHIGGLEELALANYYVFGGGTEDKPFKPQLISAINILINLWDTSLKGGLIPMYGRFALLQDYFFINALRPGISNQDTFVLLKRYRIEIFPTDHVRIERKYDWPSYGLLMRDLVTRETVFYSGDTRFDYPAYAPMLENAALCFHDAQLIEQANPVHALISELRTMPERVKKKTLLYHYGDEWDCGAFDYVPGEFAGFAQPHTRYRLFG